MTDQPTPAGAAETRRAAPMSEERIANLMAIGKVDVALDEARRLITRQRAAIAERDARIRQLEHAIDTVLGDEGGSWVNVEMALVSALEGSWSTDPSWQLGESALATLRARVAGEDISDYER